MCYLRHHSDTIRKIGAGSKGAGTDVLKLDTSRPITVWGKWGSQRTSGVETGSPGVLRAEPNAPLMDEDGWRCRKTARSGPYVTAIKDRRDRTDVFRAMIKSISEMLYHQLSGTSVTQY